ncbi:MAG: ArsB/NhaD family transporter [Rhodospirillales bacterium]|nr:ArsB/NhaD family transporter [Rhodospirillales bacterium]
MIPAEDAAHHATNIVLGLDGMIVASSILVAAYAFIISERLNRAIISLLGAGALAFTGVLTQDLMVEGIDFNTIFLLIGMMVIVAITKRTGVFQFVAILAAKAVRGNPRLLLIVLSLITAVFSALLDNVTTVLLIVPITLLLTEQLELPTYPFLFALIFASNIGGTATLIGDPPNILIGSAVGLGFMDFVYNVGPAALINMLVLLLVFDVIWGRKFQTSEEARDQLVQYDPYEALTDIGLLYKSLFTLFLVLMGFIVGHGYGLEPGTVALTGAAFLMLLENYRLKPEEQSHKVQESLQQVEWETIFFFIGLFILVYGVEHTGVLNMLAAHMINLTGGDVFTSAMTILWSSAILSAIVDNIPFVATMIPMIESMAPQMGGDSAIEPLWWALSLGACLGGNGSLIGASANVMVASFAERAGHRIPFLKFLALAFPLMLLSIVISTGYVWLAFFTS